MKIRYQPRYGTPEIELRDIKGGAFSVWRAGEERDVTGVQVAYQSGEEVETIDAATALFRHGPDFVDADTGRNPLFTCVDCGGDALDQHLVNYATLEPIPIRNEKDQPQCLACYGADRPERLVDFRARGISKSIIAAAQDRITKRSAPQRPVSTPPTPTPAKPTEE